MHTRLATAHLRTPDNDMNENGKDNDNGLKTHFFSSFFIYFTNDYLQINIGLFSPTATHHLSTATYATSATFNAHQRVMTTRWWVAFLLPPLRHLWTTNNHLCHLHPRPTALYSSTTTNSMSTGRTNGERVFEPSPPPPSPTSITTTIMTTQPRQPRPSRQP